MNKSQGNDKEDLKVTEVAKGLFAVRNAYGGDYDFFDSGEELFSTLKMDKEENKERQYVSENGMYVGITHDTYVSLLSDEGNVETNVANELGLTNTVKRILRHGRIVAIQSADGSYWKKVITKTE